MNSFELFEENRHHKSDERDAIQKKTFTKWVNKHLTKTGRRVEDLFLDLRDGFNLIALLEALSAETLPKENGYTRFHRIQNVQYCLDFLKKKHIKLVNIRPEDIVEGNGKLTLGLIWTIILNFQVSMIKHRQRELQLAALAADTGYANGHSTHAASSASAASSFYSTSASVVLTNNRQVSEVLQAGDGLSARDALLQWAKKVTSGYPGVNVTNFTNSWRNGLVFNAILHRYRPNAVDWQRVSDQNFSNRERLRNAFDTADDEFGVAKLLDPEDVDLENPDENSIITYVSSLFNALPNLDALSKMGKGYVYPTSSILLDNSSALDDIKRHAKANKLILSDKVYELNDLDEDFKKISYIGKGSYGEVNEYKHIKSNAHIAIKKVSLKMGRHGQADSKNLTAKVLREIRIHEELNSCPYIIEFYGFFIDKNDQNLYIIMELMDLTMREFYSTIHRLYEQKSLLRRACTEKLVCHLSVPLIDGLLHAKGKDILHRDIKPSNILLNYDGEVKLGDFGEATQDVQDLFSTCCGSIPYRPPERCVEENVEYDDRSDVWSLGITLAEALTNGKHYIDHRGNVPKNNILKIIHLIKTTTPEEILSRCPFSSVDSPMKEFLRDCIKELNTRSHINDLQNSSLYYLYSREREEGIRILSESVREILNEINEKDEANLKMEETDEVYVTASEMEETNDFDETNSEMEKTKSKEPNSSVNDIRNSSAELINYCKDQLSLQTGLKNKNGIINSLPTGSNLNESQNQPSTSNHISSQLNEETVNHTEKKTSLPKFGLTVFFMMVLSNDLNDIHPKTSKPKNENSAKLQETSFGYTKKIRMLPKFSIQKKMADDIGRKLSSCKSVVVGIEDCFKDFKEYDISDELSFQKLREMTFKNGCVFHFPKYYDVPDVLHGFIGSGTRSIAIEAKCVNISIKVAIKRLRSSDYTNFYKKNVSREIELYKTIRHKNIANLMDYYIVSSSLHDTKFYLVMEFGGLPLRAWILDRENCFNNPTGEKQFKYLLYQLLDGVDYLHQRDIIHGHLNPDNIMVDENFNLKITNLGVGHLLETKDVLIDTIITNLSYSAPEILSKKYEKSVDTWSIGSIFFHILTGQSLLEITRPYNKIILMSLGQKKFSHTFDPKWVDLTKEFVEKENKSLIFTHFDQEEFSIKYDKIIRTCNNIINKNEIKTIFHSQQKMLEYVCLLYTFSSINRKKFMYIMGEKLFRTNFNQGSRLLTSMLEIEKRILVNEALKDEYFTEFVIIISNKMLSKQDSNSKSTKYADMVKCDVPADGNCLFWAVAWAYLTSVEKDFVLFRERFAKLFEQDNRVDFELLFYVMEITFNYNPIENSINPSDDKLKTLVTRDFRKKVVDHMRDNRTFFEPFIKTEDYTDFEHYLDEMNQPSTWGGRPEIEAMCQILECKIQVHSTKTYDYGAGNELIVLFHESGDNSCSNNHNYYNFGLDKRKINTSTDSLKLELSNMENSDIYPSDDKKATEPNNSRVVGSNQTTGQIDSSIKLNDFDIEGEIKKSIYEKQHIEVDSKIGKILLAEEESTFESRKAQAIFWKTFEKVALHKVKQVLHDEINRWEELQYAIDESIHMMSNKNFNEKLHEILSNEWAFYNMESFLDEEFLGEKYFADEFDTWRHILSIPQEHFLAKIEKEIHQIKGRKTITTVFELGQAILSVFEDHDIPWKLIEELGKLFKSINETTNLSYLIYEINYLSEENGDLENRYKSWNNLINVINYPISPQQDISKPLFDILNLVSESPRLKKSSDNTTLCINGFRYTTSMLIQHIEKELDEDVKQVKFFAHSIIHLDCHFTQEHWHSKNVIFSAKKVVVEKSSGERKDKMVKENPITIDLSGFAGRSVEGSAKNSESLEEDGDDGADGFAGENSGNLFFYVSEPILNETNLIAILNGGNGGDGQKGGNGKDGEDGSHVKRDLFEQIIKTQHLGNLTSTELVTNFLRSLLTNFDEFSRELYITALKGRIVKGYDFRHGVTNEGMEYIFSISRGFLYSPIYSFMLIRGGKAKQSTNGGCGGFGGEGGMNGKLQVILNNSLEEIQTGVQVENKVGKSGKHGTGGLNGKIVKDGYDVGFTYPQSGPESFYFFGGENKKIDVSYTNEDNYMDEGKPFPTCYCEYMKYINKGNINYKARLTTRNYELANFLQLNVNKKNIKKRVEHSRVKNSRYINIIEVVADFMLYNQEYVNIKKNFGIRNLYISQRIQQDIQQSQERSKKERRINEQINYACIEHGLFFDEEEILTSEENNYNKNLQLLKLHDIGKIADKIIKGKTVSDQEIEAISFYEWHIYDKDENLLKQLLNFCLNNDKNVLYAQCTLRLQHKLALVTNHMYEFDQFLVSKLIKMYKEKYISNPEMLLATEIECEELKISSDFELVEFDRFIQECKQVQTRIKNFDPTRTEKEKINDLLSYLKHLESISIEGTTFKAIAESLIQCSKNYGNWPTNDKQKLEPIVRVLADSDTQDKVKGIVYSLEYQYFQDINLQRKLDENDVLEAAQKLVIYYFSLHNLLNCICSLIEVYDALIGKVLINKTSWHDRILNHIEELETMLNKVKENKTTIINQGLENSSYYAIKAFLNNIFLKRYEEKEGVKENKFLKLIQVYNIEEKALIHVLFKGDNIFHLKIKDESLDLIMHRMANFEMVPNFLESLRNLNNLLPKNISLDDICQNFGEDSIEIRRTLEKLCSPFLNYENIIKSLYIIFQANSCLLTKNTIQFVVNTILSSSFIFGVDTSSYFVHTILFNSQESFVDIFTIIRIENFYQKKLTNQQVTELQHIYLKKISNDAIKILFAIKLCETSSISLDYNTLTKLLSMLAITRQYEKLKVLKIEDWKRIVSCDRWNQRLKEIEKGTILKNFHYHLSKLHDTYSDIQLKDLKEQLLNRTNKFEMYDIAKVLFQLSSGEIIPKEDIFNHFLEDLQSKEYFDARFNLSRSYEELINIMISLDNDKLFERMLLRLKTLINETKICDFKRNINVNPLLVKIVDKLQRSRVSKVDYNNWINHSKRWVPLLPAFKSSKKYYPYLLQMIDEIIEQKFKFRLKQNQIVAILSAFETNKNKLLMQLATGEGKSIVIAIIAIMKAISEEKVVHIVTSSKLLAQRDAGANNITTESSQNLKDLYEIFGIKVDHNCYEDINARRRVYKECNVIYGNLECFQRDYLEDIFYNKKLLISKQQEIVIVDEVDSMLLDKSNYVFYLSKEIAGMDRLDTLFKHIWACVNRPLPDKVKDASELLENDIIRKEILKLFFGKISKEELQKILEVDSIKTQQIWNGLVDKNFLSNEGCLLGYQLNTKKTLEALNLDITKHQLLRLSNYFKSIRIRQKYHIPKNLQKFVLINLDQFIENAKTAMFMEEDTDYVVDMIINETYESGNFSQIIPIDRSNGNDLYNTQWNNGLHQFLQLKHNCKLTLLSLKAVFISNVSYFNLYVFIIGLSGTLGSQEEAKHLRKLYDAFLLKIPTDKPKNFYEESPVICIDKEEWSQKIFEEIINIFEQERSVLIIAGTIKDANFLHKKISEIAHEKLDNSDYEQFKYGERENKLSSFSRIAHEKLDNMPPPYKRDYEQFKYGERENKLEKLKVLIATNLAGRGTNIKLTEELIHKQGLHVIVSFLPKNTRIEDQAFGRAARCGQPGSARLIFIEKQINMDVMHLKQKRDIDEAARLVYIEKYYYNTTKQEEACFEIFSHKFRTTFNYNEIDPRKEIYCDSILDRWALWLDIYLKNALTNNKINWSLIDTEVSKIFEDYENQLSPPLLIKLVLKKLENKLQKDLIDSAHETLANLLETEPNYTAEIKYYLGFLEIANNIGSLGGLKNNEPRIRKNLGHARFLFNKRSAITKALIELIKFYRYETSHHPINTNSYNSFEEQQNIYADIYRSIGTNIDNLLGKKFRFSEFLKADIGVEKAMQIFHLLKQDGIISEPIVLPVDKFDKKEIYRLAKKYTIKPKRFLNFLKNRGGAKELGGKIISPAILMEELKIPNITYFNAIIERHRKIYGPDLQNCLEDEGAFFPFDSITKNDLIQDFGLEEDEAKYCLEELEQVGQIKKRTKHNKEIYYLIGNLEKEKFPKFYKETLIDAFESCFAYRLAYLKNKKGYLETDNEEDLAIQCLLQKQPEELLFIDLVECNLIKPTHVNNDNLKESKINKSLEKIDSWKKATKYERNKDADFIYKVLRKAVPELEKTNDISVKLLNTLTKLTQDKFEGKVLFNNGLPYFLEIQNVFTIKRALSLPFNILPSALYQMGSMDINQIVYEFRKVYVITCNHWISHREESNDNEAYQNLSQQKDIFDVIIESYTHMEKNSSSSMTASYPERNEDTEFDIDNLTKSMEKKLDSQLELQKLIDNYMSLLYQKIQTKVVEVVHEKLENSQFPIIIQKKCDIYGRSFIEKVLYRPCGLHLFIMVLTEIMKVVKIYIINLSRAQIADIIKNNQQKTNGYTIYIQRLSLNFEQFWKDNEEFTKQFEESMNKVFKRLAKEFSVELEENIMVIRRGKGNFENNEMGILTNEARNNMLEIPNLRENTGEISDIELAMEEIITRLESIDILEKWLDSTINVQIQTDFNDITKECVEIFNNYVRASFNNEHPFPVMNQEVFEKNRLFKMKTNQIIKARRKAAKDPIKMENYSHLIKFYFRKDQECWIAAALRENAPIPFDKRCIEKCCEGLQKLLQKTSPDFKSLKLVVGDKEMILDAIYPLGEEISSELHVQTIDGNIYLVPHDDVYHTKNFNKGYFSIYEALLAGYCEVDRYSTKSFCEQVAQEIYPQILETPNI